MTARRLFSELEFDLRVVLDFEWFETPILRSNRSLGDPLLCSQPWKFGEPCLLPIVHAQILLHGEVESFLSVQSPARLLSMSCHVLAARFGERFSPLSCSGVFLGPYQCRPCRWGF